jgi:hypothetical protein
MPKTTSTPASPPMTWAMAQQIAPATAASGSVSNHATTIRPITAQRTSAPLPRPVPRIAPVAVCVVDSGNPKWAEVKMIAAEADSAARPCGESISTRPLPSVRMIRQPPR